MADKVKNELKLARHDIDRLDNEIIKLLALRVRLGKNLVQIKKGQGLTVFDPGREKAIIRRLKLKSLGVDEKSVEKIWNILKHI